jgi:hypothetical protein
MNCEQCGKITTSIKKMIFCYDTFFHHHCCWFIGCLECRVIYQTILEQYEKLDSKVKGQVNFFAKTITKEMEMSMK